MDWFLYDNGLRHEWVKKLEEKSLERVEIKTLHLAGKIKKGIKNSRSKKNNNNCNSETSSK